VFYGAIQALKGVNVSVDEGEIVALLGANGAGKTTTFADDLGFVERPSGRGVRWRGERIDGVFRRITWWVWGSGIRPRARRVFAGMTVLENLHMGAYRFKSVSREDLDPWCSSCSLGSRSGVRSRRGRCPVASSRCWRSGAR